MKVAQFYHSNVNTFKDGNSKVYCHKHMLLHGGLL